MKWHELHIPHKNNGVFQCVHSSLKEKSLPIDQETSRIKFERDFPPRVFVENATISLYVESQHHFNIFILGVHIGGNVPKVQSRLP